MVERKEDKEVNEPHPLVQSLLKEFGDVFPNDLPPGLPPIPEIEDHIDLIPGVTLSNRVAHRYNPIETKELQRQVDELIARGFVRENCLLPKKDGTFRMCVGSKTINNITIKYRYPIPQLDDMSDKLHSVNIFLNIDLHNGYNQVKMREGDE